MAIEITLTPGLLAYRNEVQIEGKTIVLDLQYAVRLDAWLLSILDAEREPIISGLRVVTGWPLTYGIRDGRLPDGEFIAIRIDGGEEDAGRGELGEAVRLVWMSRAEFSAAANNGGAGLLAPRSITIL